METNEILSFDMDTAGVERQARAAAAALNGLKQAAVSLRGAVSSAFSMTALEDGAAGAEKAASNLSAQLFLLRMNLGKLKAAVNAAAGPFLQALLPAVNRGLQALTRFVKTAGAVAAALFGGTAGTQALADSADNAAAAETTLEKTAAAAGKAVNRALAGFDELEILKFSDGGGTTTTVTAGETPILPDTVTASAQPIADKLLSLLAPLRNLDFSPAAAAFRRLGAAVEKFTAAVAPGLEWAWVHILTPLAKWIIEKAVPASVDVLTAAFSALTAVLTPVGAGMQGVLTAMQPVFTFLGGAAVTALNGLKALFESLAQTFTSRSGTIQSALAAVAGAISALWSRVSPILNNWMTVFSAAFSYLGGVVTTWAGLLTDTFCGLATFLSGVFTGNWSQAWAGITGIFSGAGQAIRSQAESLKTFLASAWPAISANATLTFNNLAAAFRTVFSALPGGAKTAVNGVIGYLNSMLLAVTAGLNAVIRGVNSLSFTVPGWVPGLGGSRLGFSLQSLSCPQIPYLAQGAVLPANRPFLAMVGDQRNGTNVEAPLTTIQEAVAEVMKDYTAANLAGHEATVAALQEILRAVLGIEIGDSTIGQAAARYQRKMNTARGGA